ncbi:AAA family ATPase [uncultured Granulicatella sp.]|uniref:AAA family ATPase n=1 Tax=uncultured Granulicatella sp. TaxID=316089 RepID=UPI0028D31107|nr:AAA family ATPase [uncultured Granulicatella sp.]
MSINEQELKSKITDLREYIEILNRSKDKLKYEYNIKYPQYKEQIYNDETGNYKFSSLSFEQLFDKVIGTLNEKIFWLEHYFNLNTEIKQTKISQYYNNILNEFDFPYEMKYFKKEDNSLENFINVLNWKKLDHDINSLVVLKRFSEIEKDIVLIGGNGKGKSFLANYLKGSTFNSISVIGAQKVLNFNINEANLLRVDKHDIKDELLENSIKVSKNTQSTYDFFKLMSNQFTKLIIAMQTEYTNVLYKLQSGDKEIKKDNTVFEKVKKIFELLFQDIQLNFIMGADIPLLVEKNERKYSVNGLSEGEKVVLYYAISVLMAKDDGLIIVDEPETYLNPSISNLFWDKLKEEKPNTQFLFITHSVDFVLGRSNSQIAWIKEFIYPNEWKLELLTAENELPKQMLTEILGSSKPYLFCEGDKSSLDYTIYNGLLGEKYTVIPSGGHTKVINNVRAVNKLEDLNTAYGIIDLDNLTEDEIKVYKEDQIEVLQFNEIEMLFFEENIMEEVMRNIVPQEYTDTIEKFKREFFTTVEKNVDQISITHVKKCLENYLKTENIEKYKKLEEIQKGLNNISSYNIEILFEEKKQQIRKIVEDKNYSELLKNCNLKEKISKEIANKHLDKRYIEKAKQRILTDSNLKEYIVNNYFSFETKF